MRLLQRIAPLGLWIWLYAAPSMVADGSPVHSLAPVADPAADSESTSQLAESPEHADASNGSGEPASEGSDSAQQLPEAGDHLLPEPAFSADSTDGLDAVKALSPGPDQFQAVGKEIGDAIRVFQRETERLGARVGNGRGNTLVQPGKLWHGRIYEFLRNDRLDAVPHQVVQRGGDRNVLRRNQFGFSVSGPVYIPTVYSGQRSTFFTFSFEATRERVGRSKLATLPTALQRSSDFSDLVDKAGQPVTVYDPATTQLNSVYDRSQPVSRDNLEYVRTPFPNNVIPPTRSDRVAQATLPHYPFPNANVGPFLQNNYWVNSPQVSTPEGFILRVDRNVSQKHKLTLDVAYSKGFHGTADLYPTIGNPGRPDRLFSNRRTELSDSFSISPRSVYTASFSVNSSGVRTPGLGNEDLDIPQELGLDGVSGGVFPTVRFNEYLGLGGPQGAYLHNFWTTYGTGHALALRRGKHAWTLSSSLRFYQLNTFDPDSPSGSLRFNDDLTGLPGVINTGNSFASFLLGHSSRAEATDLLQPSYLRRKFWRSQVQDEYELTPNLTATLSVRLEVSTPRVEKFNRQSTIDVDSINPENGRPGALVFAGRDGAGRAFQPSQARLEPQAGFSWSPSRKRGTVVRMSVAQRYGSIPLRPGPFATQGFSARRTFFSANEQLQPAVVLGQGLAPLGTPLPHLSPAAANDTDADYVANTDRLPRYRYLTLDFERRMPLGIMLRLEGRVRRADNLLVNGNVAGINAVPLDALAFRDQLNDESFRRSLRPYPQFQTVDTGRLYPLGRYQSQSGSIEIEKQTSQGLAFDFSYRLRRQYDDYSGPGVQDYLDRDSEWALTPWVRPQRMSLSYSYEIPFGQGKAFLRSRGLLSGILGNWSVRGFTRWGSGDPIALRPEFNNTGGVVPYLRAQAVPGADAHVNDPGPELWFNPAAFVNPSDFSIGNVPRAHPSLRNPGFHNHDLSVSKRLPLPSERSLDILFEGFNFLNHANWNDPDAYIGSAEAPNANAGKIIGSRGGRVVQLGLQFNF